MAKKVDGRPLTYEGEPLGMGMVVRLTQAQRERAEAMAGRLQELEDEQALKEGRKARRMKLANLVRYALDYVAENDPAFKRRGKRKGGRRGGA